MVRCAVHSSSPRPSRSPHSRCSRPAVAAGASRGLRASPPPRRRHGDDAERTRSPSPAACAPTGCRAGPTPPAAACSTSRSCGQLGLQRRPGPGGRGWSLQHLLGRQPPRAPRSRPPIGLTTSRRPRACARTASPTSPTRRSRTTASGSTSRRASTRTLQVQERGGDLHQADTGGSPLQQCRRP